MDFTLIPKFVINLPRRKDRLESITKEFQRFNLDFTIWPAVDGKRLKINPNSRKKHEYNAKAILGCMKSHYNLIKFAKTNGYEYIAVFEDDIRLAKDFHKRIKYIENEDFDLFYMGLHFDHLGIDVECTKRTHIFKVNKAGGTYAYIMRNTVFDFVLENMDYNWGSDEFFANMIIPNFNCKTFYPGMVLHMDGFSDISGRYSKYSGIKNNVQLGEIL